jgi:hypothetical protein
MNTSVAFCIGALPILSIIRAPGGNPPGGAKTSRFYTLRQVSANNSFRIDRTRRDPISRDLNTKVNAFAFW